MKKCFCILTLILLSIGLVLSCYAWFPVSTEFFAETYQEYEEAIEGRELTKDFLPYERVCFLGDFVSYAHHADHIGMYTLRAPNGLQITLHFSMNDTILMAQGPVPALGSSEVLNWREGNMLKVNVDAILERTGLEMKDVEGFYISDEAGTYFYTREGELEAIRMYFGHHTYEIKTDFSKCDPNSLLGKLLIDGTAREASEEMILRFRGLDQKSKAIWEQPLTICLSAIGGAVIAAVTTWLITYFVMRKKVKNATRLGTNVENLALAGGGTAPDGESSSSESGASASPAPTEGIETDAAPPEDTPTSPNATP